MKARPEDETTVAAWLAQPDLQPPKFDGWLRAADSNRLWTAGAQNDAWFASGITIHPLLVVDKYKFTRDPNPSRVIWDLNTRPPRPHLTGSTDQNAAPLGWEKRTLYWLYVRQSPLDADATWPSGAVNLPQLPF